MLVCAVAALLALPASAGAKPGYFTSPPWRYALVHLDGSHGYHLRIEAFSTNVNVEAEKGDESVSYVAYNGRLYEDWISARLPGVGWVNLRFHEQTRYRQDPPDNCKGPGELVRRGVFRGRIRIQGERDYTRVDVRAARGRISSEPRQICRRRPGAGASAASQEELLRAVAPRGRGMLSFEANEWTPSYGSRPVFFHASLHRRRGAMAISNHVGGFTEDPQALAVAKSRLSAVIDPPSPFTGTAEFHREAEGALAWSGDLAAELPGIGPVALAGPSFDVELCVARRCRGDVDL